MRKALREDKEAFASKYTLPAIARIITEGGIEKIDFEMPDIIMERKDGMKAIIAAIGRLDENYKQVMLLRSLGDLSFRDIGEMLNKNENWARITFHRAKLKLKKEIDYMSENCEVRNDGHKV